MTIVHLLERNAREFARDVALVELNPEQPEKALPGMVLTPLPIVTVESFVQFAKTCVKMKPLSPPFAPGKIGSSPKI